MSLCEVGSERCGIRVMLVSHNALYLWREIRFHESTNCLYGRIWNMAQTQFTATLDSANNHALLLLTELHALAANLATNVGLINFYDSAKRLGVTLCHRFTDAVIQIPCGLIS